MAQPAQLGVVEDWVGGRSHMCHTYHVCHLGQLGKGYLVVWQGAREHAEPFFDFPLREHVYRVSIFLREEIPLGHLSISDGICL